MHDTTLSHPFLFPRSEKEMGELVVPLFEKFDGYMNKYIQYMENFSENVAMEICPDSSYQEENHFWKKYRENQNDPFYFYSSLDNCNKSLLLEKMEVTSGEIISIKITLQVYIWYMHRIDTFDFDRLWPDMLHDYANNIWDLYGIVSGNLARFYKILSPRNREVLYTDIVRVEEPQLAWWNI